MKWLFATIACITVLQLPAQVRHMETQAVSRQCAAIRELVYAAWHHQFSIVCKEELRHSWGSENQGRWKFSNTRFNTSIAWPGASASYLEHYEDERDSTITDTWQYIAEFKNIAEMTDAQRLLRQLNYQINGCNYPLNDSVLAAFRPLPNDSLPAMCPPELQYVSLYDLGLNEYSGEVAKTVSIMAGVEKKDKSYVVSLIVDDTRMKKRRLRADSRQ